jgi:type VI secretion system secreted protein VgrG
MDKTMPATSERIELVTPLGEELLFHGMLAREELSHLGEYQLDLLSTNREVDRDKILGAKVAIKIVLQNDEIRHFNGFVTRFSAGASLGRYARYHAVVSPWLWFLTRTADCRIFQDMTVRQIVEEVFADHPEVADFAFELAESYQPLKYCVQYRETDFNFVSRLLEHEGMYYYFRHEDGKHTMVLTDSVGKHEPTPDYEKVIYHAPQVLVRPGTEYISEWHSSSEVQPGVYVHEDYDFERPSVDLTTTKTLPRGYKPSDYEVYDYPGCYMKKPDGERWAHVRIDEYGAKFEKCHATTNYRGIKAGAKVTLDGVGVEKYHGDYVIVGTTHTLESTEYESAGEGGSTGGFQCSFTALSCSQQFRPPRATPKPFVQGPQTAVVVGPAGDEIYTDKYGRVKVQFHWDRRGKKDENSSCWIRVSHPWAGKGWGAVATPRIGQEVIVDFLEGDPDQPIITGRVYNEECQPPFGFPAGAVISGVKSDTHKGGGFNEMSLDDTAGKERVFIHGQYNMDTVIEHDQTTTVHNCRTDVIDVDDSETVSGNQTLHVVKNQTVNVDVNRTETVGANETITVQAHRSETVNGGEDVTVNGARTHTVNGAQATTISLAEAHTVGAARAHSVGGAEAITVGAAQVISVGAAQMVNVAAVQNVNVGGSQSTKVAGARSVSVGAAQSTKVAAKLSTTVGADETHNVSGGRTTSIGKDDGTKVGKNFVVDAGDSVTIKTGSASFVMKKDGTITIKGKDITIEGSGKINLKASKNIVMKGSKILEN